MLKVEQLTKTYRGQVTVLKNISFTIPAQTFTAILGSSGAGKTTLLRCLTQLTQPDQGRIWFNGQELA
jgi:phosphonate transport system ATP-binding protein